MSEWSLHKPERDAYKTESQITAMAFNTSGRKVLLIVSAENTEAAYNKLKATFADALQTTLEGPDLHHPLSYIHVTTERSVVSEPRAFSAAVSLNRSFLKHCLTSTQLFSACRSQLPQLHLFHDLHINKILAVTFMSITSIGSCISSSALKFFKILHSFDNSFFPMNGLGSLGSLSPVSAKAIYTEIRTLLSLERHHNIIAPPEALIVSHDNLVVGCVYQYHTEGDLGQYLQTHPLQSATWVVDRALEIVEAIGHLRKHDIHHGDVHLGNIVIAADDTLRLVDFGEATPLSQMTEQKEFQDVPSMQRVIRYLFSRNPTEEDTRNPLNLREDLPKPVLEAMNEVSAFEEIYSKIFQGWKILHIDPQGRI
jgi:hypothetical protein